MLYEAGKLYPVLTWTLDGQVVEHRAVGDGLADPMAAPWHFQLGAPGFAVSFAERIELDVRWLDGAELAAAAEDDT